MKYIQGYSGRFRKWGIDHLVTVQAHSEDEAIDKLSRLGYKVDIPDGIHPTMTFPSGEPYDIEEED